MLIRFLNPVISGYGSFKAGDELELPDLDATPLLKSGSAEKAEEKPKAKPKAQPKAKPKTKGAR